MYAVLAIPLRRPDVIDFLRARTPEPRGTVLRTLAQRPARNARRVWVDRLGTSPSADALLGLDDPHAFLCETHTDRLVPLQFLEEDGFLTNALGGWSPVFFGVVDLPEDVLQAMQDGTLQTDDPLLRHAQVLTLYGDRIATDGASTEVVARRMEDEMGGGPDHVAASHRRLGTLADAHADDPHAHVARLYNALDGNEPLATDLDTPVPNVLLLDALMDRLVRVELTRRTARANGTDAVAERIRAMQTQWKDEVGLTLILKGEYIAGRHRRSTILIVEGTGQVAKQPGLEPRHDIRLGATTYEGVEENWPYSMDDGAVVTPAGRVEQVLTEDVVPRLHAAFDHGVTFSVLTGLIVEEYVAGPTVQEWVQEDPDRMTPALYERILTTQQVCEALDVNNPDWHSANFIVDLDGATRPVTGRELDACKLVHIDWGAARPLTPDEQTDAGRTQRLHQVKNLAFSFHDDAIAARVEALHNSVTSDSTRMARLRHRATRLAAEA